MNTKQAAKMELLKKALMAVSFDYTTAMYNYRHNDKVVFEGDLLFMKSKDIAWTLTGGGHGIITLNRGVVSYTIGFILEYSTAQADVMAQAIEIDKIIRMKLAQG